MTRGHITLLLAVALAGACTTGAFAQQEASPDGQDLGRLITQTAERGTLKPVKGKPRFTLKLRGVARQVVWFDDRPGRRTGQIPVRRFVRSWAGYGFDAVRPNAALTLLDAKDREDTVVLELGNPRYKRKTRTVRYPARVLDAATGNLSHLEPRRDDGVPRRFRVASLFIDDAGYGLPAGCQPGLPYIKCTYTSSTTLSLDSMVSAMNNALGPQNQVDSTTPIWIQAWGGRGATGASSGLDHGAYGGYAGYAINVSWVGTLSGDELYVYVGTSGSKHANYSGRGGASTIVSTELLSKIDPSLDGLQVVAGGSGGGGKGSGGVGRGGGGGVAIASNTPPDQSGAGESGNGYSGGGGGVNGAGGDAGDKYATVGTDGLGGYGGQAGSASAVGWLDLDAVDPAATGWATGAGGRGRGGGGGGGYGGGGGGAGGSGGTYPSGGGGGGSWARGLVEFNGLLLDPAAPEDSKQADGVESMVVLTFNLGFDD